MAWENGELGKGACRRNYCDAGPISLGGDSHQWKAVGCPRLLCGGDEGLWRSWPFKFSVPF